MKEQDALTETSPRVLLYLGSFCLLAIATLGLFLSGEQLDTARWQAFREAIDAAVTPEEEAAAFFSVQQAILESREPRLSSIFSSGYSFGFSAIDNDGLEVHWMPSSSQGGTHAGREYVGVKILWPDETVSEHRVLAESNLRFFLTH